MPHPMLIRAAELLDKKSEDYNGTVNADPARADYFPYGVQSYLHMLHTKFKRLESVCLRADGQPPNFESAADSCLDLINYSAFFASFLEQEEVKIKIATQQQISAARQQLNELEKGLEEDDPESAEEN